MLLREFVVTWRLDPLKVFFYVGRRSSMSSLYTSSLPWTRYMTMQRAQCRGHTESNDMHASISVSHSTAQVISRSRFRLLGDGRLISISTRVTALAPEHGARVYQVHSTGQLCGRFPGNRTPGKRLSRVLHTWTTLKIDAKL